MIARVGPVMAVLAVALAPSLDAQTVEAGVLFQSYSFDAPEAAGTESIQLVTAPFSVVTALSSSLALRVSGAWAQGSARTTEGGDVSLGGLTDTYVGLSTPLGMEWLVVTARANLPTGSYTHSVEEALVASVIAAELLPFTLKSWGSGGSVGANVTALTQAGGWGIGLSGGYDIASEYEPVRDQQLGYRPGDQLRLRLVLDHDVGASGTMSALFGFERYGSDRVSGADLFQSGNRLEAVVSYAFATGRRSSALLFGGVHHRANGTLLTQAGSVGGATDAPSQQLLRFGTNLWIPVGRRATLRPDAEARVFRASDGASQGWVGSVGTTVDWRVRGVPSGRRLVLAPTGRFRFGRVIVSDGVETGVSGWEAGVTLRIVGGG